MTRDVTVNLCRGRDPCAWSDQIDEGCLVYHQG